MQISTKVALAISLVVLGTGTAGGAIALAQAEQSRLEDFRRAHDDSVELLAVAVAPAVAEGRYERVQAVLDNVHNFRERFPDVVDIDIVRTDGRVIASLDPTRFNTTLARPIELDAPVSGGSEHYEVSRELRLEHALGKIRAVFSKTRLREETALLQRQAAAFLLLAITLAGVLLHLVHRRLVAKRLSRLVATAGDIERGHLAVQAHDGGKDEIGELAQSFNAMARAVRHSTENLESIIAARTEELQAANRRLEQLATTDQLTGVYNRRYFDEAARRALEVARRNERPLSVVLVDADEFKAVNDTFGHPVGDEVLQAVATVLRDNARKADLVARFGGEEFAILMPEAGRELAAQGAERMRAALEREVRPRVPALDHRQVTASFGVAAFEKGDDRLEDLLSAADRAMYASKEAGRNRVTVAERSGRGRADREDEGRGGP
ncbi:MAG: diguanylate cyclase [Myxococcota bacterium]